MANITYSNKSSLNTDSSIDEKYKVTSGNMNEIKYVVNGKQDTLISGTNIKTINNDSILGSGNITVSAEDEVAISTTQPTDSEIVWINPNESVNVYGSYISNTYGTSQTIGYSQEYVNNCNTYSTDEIDTGKTWIDGKKIYRKVLAITDNGSYTESNRRFTWKSSGISNLDNLISLYGYVKYTGSGARMIDTNSDLQLSYLNDTRIQISVPTSYTSGSSGYLIIEYTKTS